MNRRRSLKNSLTLIAGQILSQLAGAATFLILARELGIEQFGILSTIYGFALFASIFIEFGASSHATRELSRYRPDWKFPGQYRSRQLMTVVLVVACIATAAMVPAGREFSLALAIGFVTAHTRLLSAPVRAALQMSRLAVISVLEKVATLVLVLGLAWTGYLSTTSFFAVTLITGILCGITLRASWGRRFSAALRRPGAKRFLNPLLGHRHLGLSAMAIGLQSLDSAAIALTAGPYSAGVYAAVGRWTQPLGMVTQAVTQSAYAEMAGGRLHRDAITSLRVNLGLLALTSMPLVVIFVFADSLTLLLLGPEYKSSADVLRVLIGAVLCGVVNSPMAALLQARRDEAFVSRLLLTVMPIQIGTMCLLASIGGALLGVFAVLIVQAAMAIILSARVRWLLGQEDRLLAAVNSRTEPLNEEAKNDS